MLRIEDTDTARSSQASVDAILASLEWLGIDWDHGPFFQSQRMDIYKNHIEQLVDAGHAYYCTCSPDEVDAMRKKAMAVAANQNMTAPVATKDLKSPPMRWFVLPYHPPAQPCLRTR